MRLIYRRGKKHRAALLILPLLCVYLQSCCVLMCACLCERGGGMRPGDEGIIAGRAKWLITWNGPGTGGTEEKEGETGEKTDNPEESPDGDERRGGWSDGGLVLTLRRRLITPRRTALHWCSLRVWRLIPKNWPKNWPFEKINIHLILLNKSFYQLKI